MTNAPIISAKDITKAYTANSPVEVLKGITLDIHAGETIAITGKSGSGKSTLLNILGTLESPSSGELLLSGEKITHSKGAAIRNTKIGFIFQSFHLLEDFTVLENVLMPAKIARKNVREGSEAHRRGVSLLNQVGLLPLSDRLVKTLSGGEKQRVCLARALCNNPDLILADEPTGNLDSANAQLVTSLLMELAQKEQKALIIVTHDIELANLCNKTFHLKEGFLLNL